jgi:DNA-binding transcriptional regulator GbsR (MarR family)
MLYGFLLLKENHMENRKIEKKGNKNMNILSLLASDNYIVINRDLLKKYGINVALMLCELASEYNYFDQNGKLEDGMFYSTIGNIHERTGLSKYQQSEALKVLDNIGIVKSVVKGIPAKRYFKIDVEELAKQIVNFSLSSCKEIGKLDSEKLETKNNNRKLINKSNNIKDKESKKEDTNNTQIEHVEKTTCRKKKKTISYDEQITEYTENEELQNALKAFLQMRSFIKKPMTEYALKLMLKKLDELGNTDDVKIAILNQSITHNWQGIFPLKDEYTKQAKQPEKKYDQNGYESEEDLMKMFYGK